MIVLMACTTYATRFLGVWSAHQLRSFEGLKRFFVYLPGSVLISLVLPSLLRETPVELLAALVTLGVSYSFGNILFSVLSGVGTVLLLRGVS